MRQKAAEGAAINAPLQGSAADIIKLAMIHVWWMVTKKRNRREMIMQVHDELSILTVAEKMLMLPLKKFVNIWWMLRN